MPPSQLGEGLNSWQKKKEEIQEPPREETWPEDERLTMVPHSQATPSETEF